MNRFIDGGRLTALHKNNINQHDLIQRLNEVAKDKVEKQARYTNGQIHKNDNGCSQG